MSKLRQEIRATLLLGIPLSASFAGDQCISLVDTMVAGRLGTLQIAATGVAASLFFAGVVFAMGILFGLDPIASQAVGAGRPTDAHRAFREACLTAVALTLPAMAIAWGMQAVLEPMGLEPAFRSEIRAYLIGRLPAILPMLLSITLGRFLQANGHGRPTVVAALVGNLVNLPASALLAAGDTGLEYFGLPAMGLGPGLGVMGIGLASALVAVAQASVLYWFVRRIVPRPTGDARPTWAGIRALFRVGVPVGLHFTSEMGVFTAVAILAGSLGPVPAGGHQIAIQLASFAFTVCLGVSSAGSVRVGHAVGRGDAEGVRLAGIAALIVAACFMLCTGAAFALIPGPLARLLTTVPEVLVAAVPLLQVAAFFQLFDGLQITAAGALRGLGDTRRPMIMNFIAHWVFGLPVGAFLTWGLGMGAVGLWWGLTIGLFVAGIALTARFLRSTSGGRLPKPLPRDT